MSTETATRLNPHTGLPAIRIGTHPGGTGHYTVWDYLQHQQRRKWREQWAKMDADDCERQHYKHYEWQLRSAIDELEVREEQLRKAIFFLSPEQLDKICPQRQGEGAYYATCGECGRPMVWLANEARPRHQDASAPCSRNHEFKKDGGR